MAKRKPVGWRKEPVRHSLAAKGIKTGSNKARPKAPLIPVMTKDEWKLFDWLWDNAIDDYTSYKLLPTEVTQRGIKVEPIEKKLKQLRPFRGQRRRRLKEPMSEKEWQLFSDIYDKELEDAVVTLSLDREERMLLDRIRDKVYALAPGVYSDLSGEDIGMMRQRRGGR